ncbi:hypothetical protein [Streptomyces sp. cmx-4-9]|uniref:hypothetical protein n=1 Tax=Streptomyces sp. cmx-4-9 TaxID=2790941 RepID=UPI003980672A
MDAETGGSTGAGSPAQDESGAGTAERAADAAGAADAADAAGAARAAGDEGGESACLLHLVCPDCGRLTIGRGATVCSCCGAPLA